MTDAAAPAVIRPVLVTRISFAVIPIVLNMGVICGLAGAGTTSLGLRAGVAAAGITLAAICYAVQARPRIIADAQHLRIRNLCSSHTVAWQEVARLDYSGKAPWPHAHLVTGETIALQAIQRWDGEHALRAAKSLRGQLDKVLR